MVLVAPTRDQNQLFHFIVYQVDIICSILKNIAPKEALIWWNANEYAAIMGTRPLATPADAPASSEETPPSGRQLRPRICPNCQQQRSSCTCTTISRKKTSVRKGTKTQQVVEASREVAAGLSREKDVIVKPGPSKLPAEMPTPEPAALLSLPSLSSIRSAASRKEYTSQPLSLEDTSDVSKDKPRAEVQELASSAPIFETTSGTQRGSESREHAVTVVATVLPSSRSKEAETTVMPSVVPVSTDIKQEWTGSMSESSQESRLEVSRSTSQSGFERLAIEIEEDVHETKNIYTCRVCLVTFDSIIKLNQHIPSHSIITEGHVSLESGGRRKKTNNVCRICSKVFISPGKLSQHMETHTSPAPGLRSKKRSGHTCRVCSKVFNTPAGLSSHMHSAHPSPGGSTSGTGEMTPGTSVVAGGSGTKRKGIHVCPVCSKVFGSPGKLSQHMYSHTGERPFACTECDKAFSSKFKLVRHALIHSSDSERRYRCSACDRSFHRKDHLQNHAKVHSVVRARWRCERCGREYGSPLSHRRHLALHAAQDDGALDCGVCGRHFSSTDDILHHLKVHAGSRTVKSPADRKFRCDHCERRFFTRKDVRRHLVVHTGKRDFLCQFCPQRFGRKDHLVRHIKKSHHQGNLPAISRTTRGGRKLRLASPTPSTTPTKTVSTEHLQSSTSLYAEGSLEEPALLSSTPVAYLEQKAEESTELPSQPAILEETSLQATAAIQTMLHSAPVYPIGEVIPKSEESSLLPAVPSIEQPSGSQLPIVYAHPPPPYPSSDIQSQQFKVFEEENRESMVKMEPSSSRPVDIMHLLSLIPSTSQSSVLPEALSGLDQDSLLLAAQQLRSDDIQRLLSDTGGAEHAQLLTEDQHLSTQLLHLVESSSSVVELAIPTANSGGVHVDTDVMAALLSQNSGQSVTVPLPRFTQAFQSQHQSQQQPQEQQQQQSESSQQQQQQQSPSEREQR